ncbi:MAG: class IIb bacteriocin, lactobin A/cerein 7B family [Prevotellaceae bacterium]|jgi:lactobin A/cerein 7B family class IIb bacteriocin|nr:class IIb bacteriocin, lactobin A/cerein 7B family [Prevotellaceae bacterium]
MQIFSFRPFFRMERIYLSTRIGAPASTRVAGIANSKLFTNFKTLFEMKTLDLNAYGVYEMNAEEMMDVDGGSLALAIALTLGILLLTAYAAY